MYIYTCMYIYIYIYIYIYLTKTLCGWDDLRKALT